MTKTYLLYSIYFPKHIQGICSLLRYLLFFLIIIICSSDAIQTNRLLLEGLLNIQISACFLNIISCFISRILNKLTPEKFDLLKGQLIDSGITSADILKVKYLWLHISMGFHSNLFGLR